MIRNKVKHALNALARRTPWHDNTLFEDCKKFWRHNTFNLKVINLGSTSAVCAFDYSDSQVPAANFAISRNPLAGDLAILKNYISFLNPNGSYVFIPLCPFSSLAGSYDYMDDRYYTILYPSTIINYSYIHEIHALHKRDNPFMYYPISALFTDFKYYIKKKNHVLSEQQLKDDAEDKIKSWMHEFSLDGFENNLSLKNQDAVEDAAKILNDIISYCIANNATPVITIPPVHQSLYKHLHGDGEKVLIDSLLSKISYTDIIIKNYMFHTEFAENAYLFQNSFLLNKSGARKFTKILLEELDIEK